MSSSNSFVQRFGQARLRLLLSLAINGLVPLVVYGLLRLLGVSDIVALAAGAAVPALRTLALWLWRRRVDWIGVLAVLSFASGLALSRLLGGSALPLEVHGELLPGTVGLACLISVIVGRPLLLIAAQLLARDDAAQAAAWAERSKNSAAQSRLSQATLIIGAAFIGDAALHVALALTLPLDVFLGLSRIVTWAILGCGLAGVWWIRRRALATMHNTGEQP